jgi:coenzyme F420 hydrogenase subunit beta
MNMNRGLKALEERVLDKGQCTACGACVSLCPYLRSWQGRVVKIHDCDLTEGRCFAYCPRTEVDLDGIHRALFGPGYEEVEMGPFKNTLMARAREKEWTERGQNGGVVSALIDLALKEGIIQAAVLTRRDVDLLPRGTIGTERKDILACAGSSYTSGPTLEAFNRGPWKGEERIGMVGLPCQVVSIAKMKTSTLEKKTPVDRISLVIGLFCTWALDYRQFIRFLRERVDGRPISKLDITPPPERLLKVQSGAEMLHIPVDEVRTFIRPACQVCIDMTAEFSDISVGTVEGREGWNTVIVRTDRGSELLTKAMELEIIDTQPYPEDNLRHLKEASLLKKRRAIEALKALGNLEDGYLTWPPHFIERILSKP